VGSEPDNVVRDALRDHRAMLAGIEERLAGAIAAFARRVRAAVDGGGRVLVFGNGGSAADAQHFAAELIGRYVRERSPLPAIALTTDTSALTAIGNDYGFEEVFARQVRGLARPGDLVCGITTSGRSENVLRGLAAGRERGATTVGLTGASAGRVPEVADLVLSVPSEITARIQEGHIFVLHLVCEILDADLPDDPR
jgi:D-sedoheptulose 7-phosphate isomerase